MQIRELCERLEAKGFRFVFGGNEAEEIYAVEYTAPMDREGEEGVLYVQSQSKRQKNPSIKVSDKGSSIILAEAGKSRQLMAEIRRLLIDEGRKRENLLRLQKMIAEGKEIYAIAGLVSEIMENPVIFVNQSFRIAAYYPNQKAVKEEMKKLPEQIRKRVYTDKKTEADEGSEVLLKKIFYKEAYWICILERDVCKKKNTKYLENICNFFQTEGRKERSSEKEQIRQILDGMLKNTCVFPEKEKEKLERLGWKRKEKYYILLIEKREMAEKIIYTELAGMLGRELYEQEEYYVSILDSGKYEEYTEKDFPKVVKFLKRNRLLAVLSMGFFDIALCHMRMLQCEGVYETAASYHITGMRYYGRYQMTHLLQVLDEARRIDLKMFCSPIILQLYEIDKKQKTDYLSTLYTYMCSGQAVKVAADAMNIHVNTMYMRINKLKDEFRIDFSDAHMLYTFRNSIAFLYQYDPSCLKDPYPYL